MPSPLQGSSPKSSKFQPSFSPATLEIIQKLTEITQSFDYSFSLVKGDFPKLELPQKLNLPFLLPTPIYPYSLSTREKIIGTYHFYQWDFKFSSILKDPSKLLSNPKVSTFIEPNFSLADDATVGFFLARLNEKRTIANYLQRIPRLVFIDLNIHPRFLPATLYGVPAGYPFYATRCHRGFKYHDLLKQYQYALINYLRKKTEENQLPFCFLVFGGQKTARYFCNKFSNCSHINSPSRWIRGTEFPYIDTKFLPLSLQKGLQELEKIESELASLK